MGAASISEDSWLLRGSGHRSLSPFRCSPYARLLTALIAPIGFTLACRHVSRQRTPSANDRVYAAGNVQVPSKSQLQWFEWVVSSGTPMTATQILRRFEGRHEWDTAIEARAGALWGTDCCRRPELERCVSALGHELAYSVGGADVNEHRLGWCRTGMHDGVERPVT